MDYALTAIRYLQNKRVLPSETQTTRYHGADNNANNRLTSPYYSTVNQLRIKDKFEPGHTGTSEDVPRRYTTH